MSINFFYPIRKSDYFDIVAGVDTKESKHFKELAKKDIVIYCEEPFQYIAKFLDKLQFQILGNNPRFVFIKNSPGIYWLR